MCGQSTADELTRQLEPYRLKTESGSQLSRAESTAMQKTIIGIYAADLTARTGREPTVGDAVKDVIQRSGKMTPIILWNTQDRETLHSRSVVHARQRMSRFANLSPTGNPQARVASSPRLEDRETLRQEWISVQGLRQGPARGGR